MRLHLRTVSASGHSHAVSMCAWPVATTRWAPDRAGTARARRRPRRGPRRRARRRAPRRRGRGRGRSPPAGATVAGRRPPASRITPSSTSRSWTSASASGSTSTSSARSRRYSGTSPAVSGDPIGEGRNCGNVGLDAASTISSTGPGPVVTRHRLAARVDALHAAGPWRRARAPRTGTRGRRGGSRGRASASTRRPDHAAGTSPLKRNHVVAHGAPQRPPTSNGLSSSSDGPASTVNGRRSACTSGSTRSCSSRVMRSSTRSRSSCIGSFCPTAHGADL